MPKKILTHCNADPAAPRFSWEAWFDGVPNSPKGYGATEQEATGDLLSRKPRPPAPGS